MEEWMRKQILTLLGAGLIGLMHPAAAQATLLDFTFSFTGTAPPGSVAGTVTGEIFGLTEGATSSATNVIVDSFPAGLQPPAPPVTLDLIDAIIINNTFTVDSMGMITAASSFTAFIPDVNGFSLSLNNSNGANVVSTSGGGDVVNFGFAGVTYTLVQPTPEPSSVTILGAGLALAALWLLRQRRRRRWAVA
jgi:hypothetical protein